ncbi:CBS domain-containing protein [Sinobaca qinghaiensis]|uniref:CBS domain-containing protein n=1 Tax=Sinobaca qinghaiensis TaxID=342944 RepID=A0A419UU73_9BACL|nr:DUF294 nucleotidyltransferase-like domain-containing protein [Sinobaca qinghaiensis]RKD68120.1 CBS domain-containing protein [Sinobaca qinghaiensis]
MTKSSVSPQEGKGPLSPSYESYEDIKQLKESQVNEIAEDPMKLNDAHDEWIKETIALAIQKVESERGPSPAHFAFFLMGSAGRKEQATFSDQDHGIVFDGSDEEHQSYFLKVGEEIREGMAHVGYPRCEGKVMASHPRWCHSIDGWKEQIDGWIETDTWETLRHLLTFVDARTLVGETEFLEEIKNHVFQKAQENPSLLKRMSENTSYLHKGVNAFGRLLPEDKGAYTGSMHIKDVGFFPYVHAMRLLAIKESIQEAGTASRMDQTSEKYPFVQGKKDHFNHMLDLRASFSKKQKTYDDVHYVPIEELDKDEKQQLKKALKEGKNLFQQTKKHMESGDQ